MSRHREDPMKTKITFAQICSILAVVAAKDHDVIVVSPAGTKTRFICSARGLGHAADEICEIPAPLMTTELDVWEALSSRGWNVEKTGHSYTATRRAGAMSTVREAA